MLYFGRRTHGAQDKKALNTAHRILQNVHVYPQYSTVDLLPNLTRSSHTLICVEYFITVMQALQKLSPSLHTVIKDLFNCIQLLLTSLFGKLASINQL